jgi:hygromycin-B 4-O-kinase
VIRKSGRLKGDVQKAKIMATQLIEHLLKSKPSRVSHHVGGLTNHVFSARHALGNFIVRIGTSPGKVNHYIKEQWVVGQAREAGVPTTEILEVGNEIVPWPYMISRKAEGEAATHHPERLAILRELGHYASIIHSIKTSGFGSVFEWSNNQLTRNESWQSFLEQELSLESRLEVLKQHKMMPIAKLREVAALLEKGAGRKTEPALNHGDLRLKNVLVDAKHRITAILDWEDSMSSLAPYWDLSVALHDLSIDERLEFLAGYGLSEERIREIAPLVRAINIINYAPYVAEAAEASNSVEMEKFRLKLSGALDLYSV